MTRDHGEIAYEALCEGIRRLRAEQGLPAIEPRPYPRQWLTAAELLARFDAQPVRPQPPLAPGEPLEY